MSVETILEQRYVIDASPSWNGYNHQGKIGILVVLKMINDLQLDSSTCNEYELELEWLEDFSIKKSNEYLSIHQVKTYDKSGPAEYKDAIWLLLAKVSDFKEIDKAYLHSTTKISKVDDREKFKDTLFKYEPPKEKEPSKEEKEKEKEKVPKKYWTPKKCHDYVKDGGLYDESYVKFEIYEYEDDCFHCNMDEVENKIKDQLKKFKKDKAKVTEKQLEHTYMYLLGLVDKNIRNRHIDIQKKETDQKATINFNDVLKIIESNFEHPSKEYAIYFLRNKFNALTGEYLKDLACEEENGLIDNLETFNVRQLIAAVIKLSDEEFLQFCMKITPHHEVSKDNPDAMLNAISSFIINNDMNDGFFEILKKIQKEIDVQEFTFIKKISSSDNKEYNISYLPTTIMEKFHIRRTGILTDKILNNSDDESLNEVDVMITKEINLPALKSEKFNDDIPEPENESEDPIEDLLIDELEIKKREYHNRISRIKKIRMVDIENAKGELDE
ncbi:ABC-three component system protein [Bacillus toyonensis]|uniref:ABC-three component system protein n=1 Tax=Bacillus toyonensis TaxID=155322 RepID=UPI003019B7C1